MSEAFIVLMGLGIITTVQFFFIINRLDGLEQKINELKENK